MNVEHFKTGSVGVEIGNVKSVTVPEARLMVVESVIPETPEFDMGKCEFESLTDPVEPEVSRSEGRSRAIESTLTTCS